MPKSLTIKSIDRQADRTYIRVGKTEIEIPCRTKAELREWVRSRLDLSDDETVLALALSVYFARDPEMINLGQIVGKTITLDASKSLAAGILQVT